MFKTESNFLSKELLMQLTSDYINGLGVESLSDDKTMCLYIPMPKSISKKYKAYCKKDSSLDITLLWCEYSINKDECHYLFFSDGETYTVTEDFSCKYLDDIIREKYKIEYGVI